MADDGIDQFVADTLSSAPQQSAQGDHIDSFVSNIINQQKGISDEVPGHAPIGNNPELLVEDVKAIPDALMKLPGALRSGVQNLTDLPYNVGGALEDTANLGLNYLTGKPFVPSGADYGQMQRTFKGIADLAGNTAGFMVGGPAGAASAQLGLDKYVYQPLGIMPKTSADQDLADLRRNAVQMGVLDLGGKAVTGTLDAANSLVKPTATYDGPTTSNPADLEAFDANKEQALQQYALDKEQAKSDFFNQKQSILDGLETKKQSILDALNPNPDLSAQSVGNRIQTVFSGSKDAFNTAEDAAWSNVDKSTPKNVYPLKVQIQDLKNGIYNAPSAGNIPSDLANVIDEISSTQGGLKSQATVGDLQNWKTRIGTMYSKYSNPMSSSYNPFAYRLSSGLLGTMSDFLENTPDVGQDWRTAVDATKATKELFNNNGHVATRILNDATNPSNIPGKIMSSPEALDQFLEVADGTDAHDALKEYVGSKLQNMSDARRMTYVNQNASSLAKLFTPDEMQHFSDLKDAINQTSDAKGMKVAPIEEPTFGQRPNIVPSFGDVIRNAFRGAAGGSMLGTLVHQLAPDSTAAALAVPAVAALEEGIRGAMKIPSIAKGIYTGTSTLSPVLDALGRATVVGDPSHVGQDSYRGQENTQIGTQGSFESYNNDAPDPSVIQQKILSNIFEKLKKFNDLKQGASNDSTTNNPSFFLGNNNMSKDPATWFDSSGQPTAELLDSLATVESNKNPNAVSKAGAEGEYQVMPKTARAYGLNPFDPAASRIAAAKELAQNYRISKDPQLAVLAYNHGIGNTMADVQALGTKKLSALKDYLIANGNPESAAYVGKIINSIPSNQG